MSRRSRSHRLLAALGGVAISALLNASIISSPASAAEPAGSVMSHGSAPQNVLLSCESGNFQMMCFLTFDSADPTTKVWFVDGDPVPSWEGKTFVSSGCYVGMEVQVVVSNEHGSTPSNTWSFCRGGEWH